VAASSAGRPVWGAGQRSRFVTQYRADLIEDGRFYALMAMLARASSFSLFHHEVRRPEE